jgi:hypothetical protein
MCDTADDGVGISNAVPKAEQLKRVGLRSADLSELMPSARELANWRESCDSHIGFVGYNKTVPGNKVLMPWIASTIRRCPMRLLRHSETKGRTSIS